MEKLIDTSALEGGKFHDIESWTPIEASSWQRGWNDAIDAIISNVSTVDAPEVVRCKDCRWFENDGYHTNCKIIRFCVEAEDYCSRGEMKDDLISRQAAIDAADDMVEPQESEDKE